MQQEQIKVDVEKIMQEIRKQARMEEDIADLPKFDQIPFDDSFQYATSNQLSDSIPNEDELVDSLHYINSSHDVSYYWMFSGNKVKVFFKRAVRKVMKCIIPPILEKQNALNARFVRCINNLNKREKILVQELEETKEFLQNVQIELEKQQRKSRENEERYLKEISTVKEKQADIEAAVQETTREIKELKERFSLLEHQSDDFSANVAKVIHATQDAKPLNIVNRIMEDKSNATSDAENEVYTKLDYFKFQNNFRGSRNLISQRQKIYLPYFENSKKPVLDIGCGRGEFLRLLKENNIEAYGIELYSEYAVEGVLNGLDVREGDGIKYLQDTTETFGGIFAGQVIEHISFTQLQTLCFSAYEKLEKGGCLILETPNPRCLSIFSGPFYVDPTHTKPIPPDLLKYIVEEVGFKDIEVHYTKESVAGAPLPMIDCEEIKNKDEVKEAINRVSNLLYGSQDYAVIARK